MYRKLKSIEKSNQAVTKTTTPPPTPTPKIERKEKIYKDSVLHKTPNVRIYLAVIHGEKMWENSSFNLCLS